MARTLDAAIDIALPMMLAHPTWPGARPLLKALAASLRHRRELMPIARLFAGSHAANLHGRTGIWFLATDRLVSTNDLEDHLRFVHDLLCPEPNDSSRISKLHDILERTHSHADITCFWRGDPGETAPQIPARFKSAIKPLAADIETDFAVGQNSEGG